MSDHQFHLFLRLPRVYLTPYILALMLTGCAVGPNFVKPQPAAPDDWTSWRSADASLRTPLPITQPLPMPWWRVFNDSILDDLQQQAIINSPDLKTAALHFAQARVQRDTVAAQRGPDINFTGNISRQRQSEYGTATRMIDLIGRDRQTLAKALSQPISLYQAGFDASWELDLWGRIRRSIEAANADVAQQAALLDLAQLSLASDVARNYFELRTTQHQIRLMHEDINALTARLRIMQARVNRGTIDHLDLERQSVDLDALKAQLPPLYAQAATSINQIALLLGEHPGTLRNTLVTQTATTEQTLPDLSLGIPSEVAQRRPDIRAAEARLRSATANIGVAKADLYPSIRLGAKFGYESYLSGEFSDWSSRTWSIGPSLNLPIFDRGRRKSVILLRQLQQQEAAINYQQTVLKAWQEIDDALSAYTAEQQQLQQLRLRAHSANHAYQLAQARYNGGLADFTTVLDAQRNDIQARRDLAASQGRLNTRFVTINKVLGNVSDKPEPQPSTP